MLTSDQGTNKCIRDTKEYILKAVVEDIRYGGNYNSVIAGRGYLTKEGGLNYVGNELLQSIYAWTELANVINFVITTTSADYGTNFNGTKYTQLLRIPNNFASPASSLVTNEITDLLTPLQISSDLLVTDSVMVAMLSGRTAITLLKKLSDGCKQHIFKDINGTVYDKLASCLVMVNHIASVTLNSTSCLLSSLT